MGNSTHGAGLEPTLIAIPGAIVLTITPPSLPGHVILSIYAYLSIWLLSFMQTTTLPRFPDAITLSTRNPSMRLLARGIGWLLGVL